MTQETRIKIEEAIGFLYEKLIEKPLAVYEIFKDYFGEHRVDIQFNTDIKEFTTKILEQYNILCLWDGVVIPPEYKDIKCNYIKDLPDDFDYTKLFQHIKDPSIYEIQHIEHHLFSDTNIIIHFPYVRITNENNKYIDITQLWAKVQITTAGKLISKFKLNRSEYTYAQFVEGYMHSHVSSIDKSNLQNFQTPCTGNGPINNTIDSLRYNCNFDIWNLFCLELDKYVQVESINGVPYNYLEKVGTSLKKEESTQFTVYKDNQIIQCIKNHIPKFVEYLIRSKKLKFNYFNGSFGLAMPYIEYIVLVSNIFIDWYNDSYNKSIITVSWETFKNKNILRPCIISNNKVYTANNIQNARQNLNQYIGKHILTFKGKDISLSISDIDEVENTNTILLLNKQFALFILSKILEVLNFRYGRRKAEEGYTTGSEVWYL